MADMNGNERIHADQNEALMRGIVQSEPQLSHITAEHTFFTFPIAVARLSGTEDVLNVVTPDTTLSACPIERGGFLEIIGSVRSRNTHENEKYRLILTVYAHELRSPPDGAEPYNHIQIEGVICKPPIYRITPLGREVCDIMLAVRRRYGRADFLPLIAWGKNAISAKDYQVGDRLGCEGRFQSREYTKIIEGVEVVKTAYEVSLSPLSKL